MRTRRGFTLFELVMMILVVGIVMAVLLTYMSSGRESAYDAQCKSNLRQLARACTTYAVEHGVFPWGMRDEEGYRSYCWDFSKRTDSVAWEPGELWEGYDVKSIVSCPKCRAESDNWDGCGFTGYNYNCTYVGKCEGDPGGRTKPLKWSAVRNPERLLLFGDGGYAGGMNKFMRAPQQDSLHETCSEGIHQAGTQQFRHRGRSNAAFADGHVESFAKSYTIGGKEGYVSEKMKTGFLSPDNRLYGQDALGIP